MKNCRVFSIIANRFTVFDDENSFVCTIKGKVKKFKKIMVGDYVTIDENNSYELGKYDFIRIPKREEANK